MANKPTIEIAFEAATVTVDVYGADPDRRAVALRVADTLQRSGVTGVVAALDLLDRSISVAGRYEFTDRDAIRDAVSSIAPVEYD